MSVRFLAGQALGQVKARIDVAPGDVDDFTVERYSTLAGSVESPFRRRDRCVERALSQ
jgi:hypothetical protein